MVAGMLWTRLRNNSSLRIDGKDSIDKYREWLRANLHNWGATYTPDQLLHRVFGRGYDPQGLLQYLEHKYLSMN
jgi:carboxypeptidase Taq